MTIVPKRVSKTAYPLPPVEFEQLVDINIHKPAQYMGYELGIKKRDWESHSIHWVLTYPELYEIGASNLGHIILYSILNNIPNQFCDRAYLPEKDLSLKLRQKNISLFAVESRRPLQGFDVLGFSLSYELGATNILEMLNLAGIPIYAKDRSDFELDDQRSSPLVFAGGPTATGNPEPYAAFFDFFALGDGEELLPEIGLVLSECKKLHLTRSESLLWLSEINGVYVPSLYKFDEDSKSLQPLNSSIPEKVKRRVSKPMPYYATGLVPNIETVHDRLTIEIRRGCTRGCRFCQPGMLTRPARDVEPSEVIKAVEEGMNKTGYSDFSLLSLSCSDYLSLPAVGVELRNRLAEKNITLQLPSQRVDRFDENIAHILGGSRKAGLTFAPEAGTQRLRNIVNKGLTDSELLNGIRKAMEKDYKRVKLYFMIGLPGETDMDVIGIAKTCKWLQENCKDIGHLNLNITISNFTPKPHTPFQWHSVSKNEFIRRQSILKKEFILLKGVKVNFTDVRISAIEDFLGRGDRKLAPVIESAWKTGAGMDAWFESQDRAYEAWSSAIKKAGLDKDLRELEMGNWGDAQAFAVKDLIKFCSQPLPWDHIDTGVDKNWLMQDLQSALKEVVVDDCSFNACSSCGVCGQDLGQNQIEKSPEIPILKEPQKPHIARECRIRLSFEKTNPMHLVSHLDLMRILERSLRRCELPVSYSGGFHPLPRIQIALALPLGVEAFGEWMDIDFYQKINPESVISELQQVLPAGINLLKADCIPIKKTSLSQELVEATWSFNLKVEPNQTAKLSQVNNLVEKIINQEKLIWKDLDKKGRMRERDFKPMLKALSCKADKVDNKDLSGKQIINIQLETYISPLGQSIKPIHVQFWMQKTLGKSLEITDLKRNQLILKRC